MRKQLIKIITMLLMLLIVLSIPILAETQPTPKHAKVTFSGVLSGGSAEKYHVTIRYGKYQYVIDNEDLQQSVKKGDTIDIYTTAGNSLISPPKVFLDANNTLEFTCTNVNLIIMFDIMLIISGAALAVLSQVMMNAPVRWL